MPAWQFYHLIRPSSPVYLHHIQPCFCSSPPRTIVLIDDIAWHTEKGSNATNEDKIADHFQSTRPVLGVCLKRYTFSPDGHPLKKKTYIDIPLDLRLPHFVNEDQDDKDRSLEGQFKLSLQSVICHRGEAINSGHYVAFIRGTTPAADGDSHSTRTLTNEAAPPGYAEERWIMFDDNGNPRVQYADISKALKNETPYLLFYQVQPIYDVTAPPPPGMKPPSYTDSGIAMSVTESNPEPSNMDVQSQGMASYFDGANEEPAPTIRVSSEYERHASPRISLSLPDDRRGSLAQTDTSVTSLASTASSVLGTSAPVSPGEETTAQRFSRAAASITKFGSKSRTSSQSGENRISATFSRLSLMGTKSKEQLPKSDAIKQKPNEIPPSSASVAEPRKSITIDESSLRPAMEALQMTTGNGAMSRSKSKKEKKRDKSKGPSEKFDSDHKEKGKGKAKDENKVPDRECMIM